MGRGEGDTRYRQKGTPVGLQYGLDTRTFQTQVVTEAPRPQRTLTAAQFSSDATLPTPFELIDGDREALGAVLREKGTYLHMLLAAVHIAQSMDVTAHYPQSVAQYLPTMPNSPHLHDQQTMFDVLYRNADMPPLNRLNLSLGDDFQAGTSDENIVEMWRRRLAVANMQCARYMQWLREYEPLQRATQIQEGGSPFYGEVTTILGLPENTIMWIIADGIIFTPRGFTILSFKSGRNTEQSGTGQVERGLYIAEACHLLAQLRYDWRVWHAHEGQGGARVRTLPHLGRNDRFPEQQFRVRLDKMRREVERTTANDMNFAEIYLGEESPGNGVEITEYGISDALQSLALAEAVALGQLEPPYRKKRKRTKREPMFG